jgi:hypothetical protein
VEKKDLPKILFQNSKKLPAVAQVFTSPIEIDYRLTFTDASVDNDSGAGVEVVYKMMKL